MYYCSPVPTVDYSIAATAATAIVWKSTAESLTAVPTTNHSVQRFTAVQRHALLTKILGRHDISLNKREIRQDISLNRREMQLEYSLQGSKFRLMFSHLDVKMFNSVGV